MKLSKMNGKNKIQQKKTQKRKKTWQSKGNEM